MRDTAADPTRATAHRPGPADARPGRAADGPGRAAAGPPPPPSAASSPRRPAPTAPTGPSAPRPPAPPAAPGSDDEARSTAASWVGGLGAGLLLAAAATFLAVSWDALAPVGRIAVVAAVTGAAVLGGHQLRRSLPAVGAAVFHLGALLVPIDALGLAVQLDASSSARWAATGLTALLVLPPLAVAGRSRVLLTAAAVGVPVAATGLGAPTPIGAAPLVAVTGLALALAAGRPDGPAGPDGRDRRGVAARRALRQATTTAEVVGQLRRALGGPAVGLALAALLVPLGATVVAASLAAFGGEAPAHVATWVPTSALAAAVVAVLATATVAIRAVRRRTVPAAVGTLATGLVGLATVLVPGPPPRWALLLVPATALLLLEVAAFAGRAEPVWRRATLVAVTAAEVVGGGVALASLAVLVSPPAAPGTDPALGLALGVVAAAWAVAALRAVTVRPALVAATAVQLAVAGVLAGVAAAPVAGLLLAAVVGLLVWVRPSRPGPTVLVAAASGGGVLVLLGLAAVTGPVAAAGRSLAGAVLVLAGAAAALVAAAGVRARRDDPVVAATIAVAGALLQLVVAAWAVTTTPVLDAAAVTTLAVGWLAVATVLDDRGVAVSLRVAAVAVGLVAVWPLPGATGMATSTSSSAVLDLAGLRVVTGAVGPALLVGGWLAVEAWRRARPELVALAAPVTVRALAGAALGATGSVAATGVLLALVAVGAGVAASFGAPRWRVPAAVAATTAGTLAWVAIGDVPVARAAALLLGGVAVAVVGLARRRSVPAVVGALLATIGWWQLLVLAEVDALDAWVAPVALVLAAAGAVARHHDGSISSWVAELPPVALLGLAALVERATGGGGIHAVVAGAVAVVAVVVGGARRLLAPLAAGTLLVVAVVGIETVAVAAAVPTWAWLTLGGVGLLGAAAVIERTGGRPVRALRDAHEVLAERYR